MLAALSVRAAALCYELKPASGAREHKLLPTLSGSLMRLKNVYATEDHIVSMG